MTKKIRSWFVIRAVFLHGKLNSLRECGNEWLFCVIVCRALRGFYWISSFSCRANCSMALFCYWRMIHWNVHCAIDYLLLPMLWMEYACRLALSYAFVVCYKCFFLVLCVIRTSPQVRSRILVRSRMFNVDDVRQLNYPKTLTSASDVIVTSKRSIYRPASSMRMWS